MPSEGARCPKRAARHARLLQDKRVRGYLTWTRKLVCGIGRGLLSPLWGHTWTPREEVNVTAKKKPKDRLAAATAALNLLEVLGRIVETIVRTFIR